MNTVEFTNSCVRQHQRKFPYLALLLALGAWGLIATIPAVAQIVEDHTLGHEHSVVTSVENIRGSPAELIQGGATRGANLFHSFQEFNVNEGQRVYFANPNGIENILSRITGKNISQILGTVGVNGSANLFLLNPNGIIFGQNAHLDVAGSFVGSTAKSFAFPDGSEFSATNPQAPPLLKINLTPGLQYGKNPTGDIVNQGNLAVGQNLTLTGNNLNLQGQLYAGNDLNLQAQHTLSIQDTTDQPFIAAARGKIIVQGNQAVDIFALNHSQSGLFSAGDMIMQSANPVGGDAHFWSGGSFRIEQLNGNLGNLWSSDDPIIRANGNVSFDTYIGASLHIFAGGSVNLGSVTINGKDTSDFINETVTLSDGVTTVAVNGSSQPTLDVRAGMIAISSPLGLTGSATPTGLSLVSNTTPTADINIDSVNVIQPDGLVFLTNQYQPNAATSGAIQIGLIRTDDKSGGFSGNSGDIFINSRSGITFSDLVTVSSSSGDAGNISLIANEVVALVSADLRNETFGAGRGGNIIIKSGSMELSGNTPSGLFTQTRGSGNAGDLEISTGRLLVQDGSTISTQTFGAGKAGNLEISAAEAVEVIGTSKDNNFVSSLTSDTNAQGDAGKLKITTGYLRVRDGAIVSTRARRGSQGMPGMLDINASETVEVSGRSKDGNFQSFIGSINRSPKDGRDILVTTGHLLLQNEGRVTTETLSTGNGGDVKINAGSLLIENGGGISTNTFAQGSGGNLLVNTSESIELSGIAASGFPPSFLVSQTGGDGKAGNLTIFTKKLSVHDGAIVSASTFGKGNAGILTVNASEFVKLMGTRFDPDDIVRSSGLFTDTHGSGNAGDLRIDTLRLVVANGATVSTNTFGEGKAGNLVVIGSELVELSGTKDSLRSGIQTQAYTSGDGGNVSIETRNLTVKDGAFVSTVTFGEGQAGNLTIRASESVELTGIDGAFATGLFTETDGLGSGGDLTIQTGKFIARNGGYASASSFGEGKTGNLNLTTSEFVELMGSKFTQTGYRESSGLFTFTQGSQDAGNVKVDTKAIVLIDEAIIAVNSQGSGRGGKIQLQADSLTLDNKALISAETLSNQGGNINIDLNQLLLMRNNSRISATAGIAGVGGNGGNITINAKNGFLVAVPKENNDITANAFNGKGGQVTITAQGIFGFVPLSRQELAILLGTDDPNQLDSKRLPTSDITAISQNNPSVSSQGTVAINTADTDPSRGLTELPTDIVDASQLIRQDFCTRGQGSKFIITGKGGITPSPNEPPSADLPWDDLRLPTNSQPRSRKPSGENAVPRSSGQKIESSKPEKIIEAQGLLLTADGQAVLTASPMKVTPQGVWLHPHDCQMLRDGS